MTAILPDLNLKLADEAFFLRYQSTWILDKSQMMLAEKSVRIGWTFADAYRNVRKRLEHAKRDYLFVSKDQATAIEYVQTCKEHAERFNWTKSILSQGEMVLKAPVLDDEGRSKGFDEEFKVGFIKFENGSRILAFSANPNATRAYGGDVGWDEAAFAQFPDAMWKSLAGRTTWGYDISVWSSHNGDDTLFNGLVQEAAAGDSPWSYYRVTMPDAIELGLVEKINQVSGSEMSRESFWQSCKDKARFKEALDQEYLCIPQGGSSNIVDWGTIAKCSKEYEIERIHLEEHQVAEQFGEFESHKAVARDRQIQAWMKQAFKSLFATTGKHRLGFDVAASGKGDLACFYIERLAGSTRKLVALLTCRTEDWAFLKSAGRVFMRNTPAIMGAGDETGLGRQICWELAKEFGGLFLPVNFGTKKGDMGVVLMEQLQAGEKIFPRGEKDIPADFYALKKTYQGKRWIFSEGKNPHNPNSHADIAWAGALASEADNGNAFGWYL